jgi:hypothetical protein
MDPKLRLSFESALFATVMRKDLKTDWPFNSPEPQIFALKAFQEDFVEQRANGASEAL